VVGIDDMTLEWVLISLSHAFQPIGEYTTEVCDA